MRRLLNDLFEDLKVLESRIDHISRELEPIRQPQTTDDPRGRAAGSNRAWQPPGRTTVHKSERHDRLAGFSPAAILRQVPEPGVGALARRPRRGAILSLPATVPTNRQSVHARTIDTQRIARIRTTAVRDGTADFVHNRRSVFAQARYSNVMAAGEGIETMLSVRSALPDLPMVAALSASHLAALLFRCVSARRI
jgi:hypothetical protein